MKWVVIFLVCTIAVVLSQFVFDHWLAIYITGYVAGTINTSVMVW
jgi:hypothetical protein